MIMDINRIDGAFYESVETRAFSYVEDKVKKLNIFILPQVAWIVELYYLMFNSIMYICDLLTKRYDFRIMEKFPVEVDKYNNIGLWYIDKWIPFVGYMSIAFLISGTVISLVKYIPIVKNYRSIWIYASYGLTSFFWFGLISITYLFYSMSRVLFPVTIIIVVSLTALWEKIIKFIGDKFNYD